MSITGPHVPSLADKDAEHQDANGFRANAAGSGVWSDALWQGAVVRPLRRGLLVMLVLGVLVVLVSGYGVVHAHLYRVSLLSPAALPARVQVCGRHFAISRNAASRTRHDIDAAAPDREPLRRLETFAPPLHRRMDILGRPDESVCGMEVFVGDDDHLAEYVLMGGP